MTGPSPGRDSLGWKKNPAGPALLLKVVPGVQKRDSILMLRSQERKEDGGGCRDFRDVAKMFPESKQKHTWGDR